MLKLIENPWVWAAGAVIVAVLVLLRRKPRPAGVQPEALFVVTTDSEGVRVVDPSGQERRAAWSALERLVIRTTDTGPLLADVFWIVQPIGEPVFFFPGGATGETEFLRMAQAQLPAFDNDQVIAAMGSSENREFVAWQRGQ